MHIFVVLFFIVLIEPSYQYYSYCCLFILLRTLILILTLITIYTERERGSEREREYVNVKCMFHASAVH